jgi:hypothetical protein
MIYKSDDIGIKAESTIINKDKTFNRLKELQILVKKESALKELCK